MIKNSYTALGYNPVPGDPGELTFLGNAISIAAEAVARPIELMNRLDTVWSPRTSANVSYHSDLAEALELAQGTLDRARTVAMRWSTEMASAQETAKRLERDLATARENHARAITALQQAKADPDFELATRVFTDSTQFAAAQERLNQAASRLASATSAVDHHQKVVDGIIETATMLYQTTAERRSPDGHRTGAGTKNLSHTPKMSLPEGFPPVVYLPVLSEVRAVEDAQIMLRRTRDGRVACLAYSALDRLLDCCGSDQPWMWAPTAALDALQQAQPFDLIFLDLDIPAEHRRADAK